MSESICVSVHFRVSTLVPMPFSISFGEFVKYVNNYFPIKIEKHTEMSYIKSFVPIKQDQEDGTQHV